MTVSEMMEQLVRSGHIVPRGDNSQAPVLGTYRQVPSITVYGNVPESAMMAATNAKLEQYPPRN